MPPRNKYDFIKDLLVDKNLNQSQREKLFVLIAKELDIGGNLSERVKKIEEALNIGFISQEAIEHIKKKEIQEQVNPKIRQEQEIDLPPYIYPSNLYKFLFAYNQDSILKYTCHLIDIDALKIINKLCGTETYDYKLHYNKIVDSFKELEKKYGHASKNTKALIRSYLTGKDYYGKENSHWGSEKIEFNWANEEINDWVYKNHCPPNPDVGLRENRDNPRNLSINKVIKSRIIPDSDNYEKEFRIRTFSDLIIYFKHLFHIRYDNSLLNILLFQNVQKGWDDKIEFVVNEDVFPKNIEFFTDVDKLIQAYNKITALIIEVSQNQDKPIVELKLKELEDGIELSVHHKNSKYKKTLQNALDRIGSIYKALIKNQINGLCDFYVQADFGDGNYAKVNIWNEDFVKDGPKKRKVLERYENFEGVEHILVFKKK